MRNSFEKISLNSLTKWSRWPHALLSGNLKFDSGYGGGRYEKLLGSWREGQSFEGTKAAELANTMPTEYGSLGRPSWMCFSQRGELFVGPIADVLDTMVERTAGELAACRGWNGARAVIELGCGYGYNLRKLSKHAVRGGRAWMGGELNPAAVELGRRLFGEVRIIQLDMIRDDLSALFDLVPLPVVVLTHHAVEQLGSYGPVLEGLRRHRSLIAGVVHREPILMPSDMSLLGELRRAYRRARGYNEDMTEALSNAPDVVVDRMRYDDIGANPLNPTGTVAWRFV